MLTRRNATTRRSGAARAEPLVLIHETVKSHVRVLAKRGARDRTQAVVVAFVGGYVME